MPYACPEDDHGFDPAAVWQHPDHGNKRIALSGAAGTGVGLLCFFCKDLPGVLQGLSKLVLNNMRSA